MKYCLLTGATGLLGRYLMRDLPPARSTLGGSSTPHALRIGRAQRVDAVLNHWEQEWQRWLPRPVVFEGDINAPNLGLSRSKANGSSDTATGCSLRSESCVSAGRRGALAD